MQTFRCKEANMENPMHGIGDLSAKVEACRKEIRREIERIDQRLAELRAHVDRAIEICTDPARAGHGVQK